MISFTFSALSPIYQRESIACLPFTSSWTFAVRFFAIFAPFCGYFVFCLPFASLREILSLSFCALCALLRLSRLCYRLFAERISFELANGFFDAAGARFLGLGAFDRYDDRLFFAVG